MRGLSAFVFAAINAAWCQHFEAYVKTGDGKYLCHGDIPYTTFPEIPDNIESIECVSQFFTEFPNGTFKGGGNLLSVDISQGNLKIISRDTFEGAMSLRRLNVSRCKLQGEIHVDTFCKNTPNLRSVDFSYNPDYVFNAAPFKCLRNLAELRITGTAQNCTSETDTWITEASKEILIVGYSCTSPNESSAISPQDCSCGGWIAFFVIFLLAFFISSGCNFYQWKKSKKSKKIIRDLREECNGPNRTDSDTEREGMMNGKTGHGGANDVNDPAASF